MEEGVDAWVEETPSKYFPYILDAIDTFRVIEEFGAFPTARGFDEGFYKSLIDSIDDAHGVEGLPHCAIGGCTAAAEVGILVDVESFQEDVFEIDGPHIFDDYPDAAFEQCLAAIPVCQRCHLATISGAFLELDESECIIYSAPIPMMYHFFEHCGEPFLIEGWSSRCRVCRLTLDQMDYQNE